MRDSVIKEKDGLRAWKGLVVILLEVLALKGTLNIHADVTTVFNPKIAENIGELGNCSSVLDV